MNPRQPVLETGALPTELPPYGLKAASIAAALLSYNNSKVETFEFNNLLKKGLFYLCFFVQGVLALKGAILLEL